MEDKQPEHETVVERACEKTIADVHFYRERRRDGTLGPYKHEPATEVCMSRYEDAELLALSHHMAFIVVWDSAYGLDEYPFVYNLHSIEEDILSPWGHRKEYWVNRKPGEFQELRARAREQFDMEQEDEEKEEHDKWMFQERDDPKDVAYFFDRLCGEDRTFEFMDGGEILTCGEYTWTLNREEGCYEMNT